MSSRNTWYNWFGTGKKPLATQFKDVFDTLFHKDEDTLPLNKVQGLQDILNNKADKVASNKIVLPSGVSHYDMPAGSILLITWFIAPTIISAGVGTALNVNDVFEIEGDSSPNGFLIYQGFKPFLNATRIYFNGIQPDTIPIIYLL
ncbi:MAG: hypothetical protein C0459_03480 [Chitinophaga sp.]|jgi:hypothetical protein|nr:hypothetical protein [Chitinophaga sp.]